MARASGRLGLLAAVLVSLVSACSVQLTSPYDERLAEGLSDLHRDVQKFAADVARTAANPATAARASYDNYVRTYDDFHARVGTMRVISEVGNPQVVNCGELFKRLRAAGPRADAPDDVASDANVDCQTFLFSRLQRMLSDVEETHRLACDASKPGFQRTCVGVFGAAPGAIRFDVSTAVIVQPTLSTIRTLMWVQETKKPRRS